MAIKLKPAEVIEKFIDFTIAHLSVLPNI